MDESIHFTRLFNIDVSLVTWMRYIGKHAKCDGFEVKEWKWLFEMDCSTIALSRLVVTVDEVWR